MGLEWIKVRRRGEGFVGTTSMGRGAAGAHGGCTAESCELLEELDSATCFLLPLCPRFIFISCFPSSVSPPVVFSPLHLSLLYHPLPTESYFTVDASLRLKLSFFLSWGTALLLSITHLSDPQSPCWPSSS